MRLFLVCRLRRYFPSVYFFLYSYVLRRRFRLRYFQFQAQVRARLFGPEPNPIQVLTGPFHGMRYFNETVWDSITPKWVGSYEEELHPIITETMKRSYPTVIDLGCAEGYYAVGLALGMPDTRIWAFDVDMVSRRQCRRLAQLNGVSDRIVINGRCRPETLNSLHFSEAFVLCDIEGSEVDILNPLLCPVLLKTDLLVELHNADHVGMKMDQVLGILQDRFATTHDAQTISFTRRMPEKYRHLGVFPASDRDISVSVDEHRDPAQQWLLLRRRSS